jgi:hypothetical protein
MRNLIRFPILVLLFLSLLIPLAAFAAPKAYPEVIPTPNGFQLEGIAAGRGHTFYFGSLNGGAIFAGDARSGHIKELVPSQPVGLSVGMDYVSRSNQLFVANGFFGTGSVYHGTTGETLGVFPLTAPFAGFINDVIVTRDGAYFTDSFQPYLYKIPLSPNGSLPDPNDIETIALGGEYVFDTTPGVFNSNGIVATPNGDWLIIVSAGVLYRVDPTTGEATTINLTGASAVTGDGLVLNDNTLYVVQNLLNQIGIIELNEDLTEGVGGGVLTSAFFRIPTTAAKIGGALYAVNARFDEIDPQIGPDPDDTFEAVRVELP